ncbi:hemerythrin domain-containing protein [Sphaerisporangium sp. TRM90804]|uniref:hemerythrin domain-containing protein n=1 Tax=Sphaerisporangium sp. TRM90804 TaxID=3031113 RepID=UPI002446B82C|nr:hemerythrin domain-containing protein [Sphaerisporangium sp. TRM90804]MDH2427462.1 hemerythrin domain-containing protein [Sphaerisporangium sp. TRM90804]
MANVFEVLERDHEEVKSMMSELESGPAARGMSDGDRLARRKRQVERLITEESKHEAVEEEYFWPAVRELVPNGRELAEHAVRQEQEAKFVLNDLIGFEPGNVRHEEMLSAFIEAAREHIAYEEREVWPELRLVISPERADELGSKLQRAKRIAPTRPHPHTPPRPGVLKATGPFVGAADRIRDLVSGRSRH